jgi:dipeptidyl aminopeptidase/acylaminoacyl peptidase
MTLPSISWTMENACPQSSLVATSTTALLVQGSKWVAGALLLRKPLNHRCDTSPHSGSSLRAQRFIGIGLVLLITLAHARCFAAEPVQLTTDGHSKRDPVFFNPEGTELLYVRLEKPNQLRLIRHSLVNQTSTPFHPAETRSEFEPAVSANGRYLSFVQNRGNLSLALVIDDLMENQTHEVPPGGGFSGVRSPAFVPDNSRLLFSYPEEGRQQIYSVDLQAKNRRTVIDSEGVNNWPHFSSDGKQFVFSSSRDDDYEIYVAQADGSHARRLTNSPGQDIRPRFSPDGNRIVFTSNRDGNYEIYLMNTDGGNLVRITNHPEQDDYAIWSPDGKRLVHMSERNGSFDFYQIEAP